MKAFHMDETQTYAAEDSDAAIRAYREDHGADEEIEDGYPIELTDKELDEPWPEFDENERMTGNLTCIRDWLSDTKVAGFLCGTDWQ